MPATKEAWSDASYSAPSTIVAVAVAQDYSKAISLFQKACDGRYITGCALLGRLYESGYGINRDYSEARLLYQKACDGRNDGRLHDAR